MLHQTVIKQILSPSPGGYCIALYVHDVDSFVLSQGTLISPDHDTS